MLSSFHEHKNTCTSHMITFTPQSRNLSRSSLYSRQFQDSLSYSKQHATGSFPQSHEFSLQLEDTISEHAV
jgi:hypothetical protein